MSDKKPYRDPNGFQGMRHASNKKGDRRSNRRSPVNCDSATRRKYCTQYPSIRELKSAAEGQWASIFYDAAGVTPEQLNGRGQPCPRCGGRDRFAAFSDVAQRGSVLCRGCFNSKTDPRPGDGIATLRWLLYCDLAYACKWLAEWLGLTSGEAAPITPNTRRSITLRPKIEHDDRLERLANACHKAMKPESWVRLEEKLGLPVVVLQRLGVGWSEDQSAITWPMRNPEKQVLGIRLRCMKTGRKWSVRGGKEGLFIPAGLSSLMQRLFIAEGPTDTAALLSLGFSCIGRPSCSGAVDLTTQLVKQLSPKEVIIVADQDANRSGQRGAETLAKELVPFCSQVRIIYPPDGINDARDWIIRGATERDVLTVIEKSKIWSLTLKEETQE